MWFRLHISSRSLAILVDFKGSVFFRAADVSIFLNHPDDEYVNKQKYVLLQDIIPLDISKDWPPHKLFTLEQVIFHIKICSTFKEAAMFKFMWFYGFVDASINPQDFTSGPDLHIIVDENTDVEIIPLQEWLTYFKYEVKQFFTGDNDVFFLPKSYTVLNDIINNLLWNCITHHSNDMDAIKQKCKSMKKAIRHAENKQALKKFLFTLDVLNYMDEEYDFSNMAYLNRNPVEEKNKDVLKFFGQEEKTIGRYVTNLISSFIYHMPCKTLSDNPRPDSPALPPIKSPFQGKQEELFGS